MIGIRVDNTDNNDVMHITFEHAALSRRLCVKLCAILVVTEVVFLH